MGTRERPSIAIVTTCKGRIAFLKQVLPAMLDSRLPIVGAVQRPLSAAERQEIRKIVSEVLGRAKESLQAARFSITLQTIRVDATPDVASDAAYSLAREFHYAASLG